MEMLYLNLGGGDTGVDDYQNLSSWVHFTLYQLHLSKELKIKTEIG